MKNNYFYVITHPTKFHSNFVEEKLLQFTSGMWSMVLISKDSRELFIKYDHLCGETLFSGLPVLICNQALVIRRDTIKFM